ncbi:MAG: hypothetical protein ABI346_06395 [Candidatus Baltobacteraceae bacterium]
MRTSLYARGLLAIALSVAFLNGCGAVPIANAPVLPGNEAPAESASARRPVQTVPWIAALPEIFARRRPVDDSRAAGPAAQLDPVATRTLVVCAISAGVCTVFSRPGYKPLRTIVHGLNAPGGVVAGIGGRIYVANSGGANVRIYAPGGTHPIETLNDPGAVPIDVALAKQTTIVSNLSAGSSTNVAVYVGGAKSPSYTLSDPLAQQGIGVAVDAGGNCFWSVDTSSGAQIDQFPGCKKNAHPLRLKASLGSAGGLAFDGAGNLWYADQSSGVYRCVGVMSCTLVVASSPSCTPGVTLCDPVMINFDRNFTTLFVADAGYGVYTVRSFGGGVSPDYVVTPILQAPGMPIGVGPDPAPTLPPH